MIIMVLCFCMSALVQFTDSKLVILSPGLECKHRCVMECAGECFHAVLVEVIIMFISIYINTRFLSLILVDCYTRNHCLIDHHNFSVYSNDSHLK